MVARGGECVGDVQGRDGASERCDNDSVTEGQLAALLSGVVRHGPRDEKLPHKRLALLFAIARVARGDARLFRFADAEAPVADLISRFGPPVSSPPRPEYPLYRLVNDGDGQLWEISRLAGLRARENSGTHTGLVGGFRPPRPPRDGLEDDA